MYCDDEESRKDLFQEILVQLWRAYPSFKGDSKFTTWAYRVGLNTAISDFRKKKRRPTFQELSITEFKIPTIPTSSIEKKEETELLYKAINQLSKIERGIIMLYLEEYAYDEIAEMIGITKTHVGVKILRIKNKLKKILMPLMK